MPEDQKKMVFEGAGSVSGCLRVLREVEEKEIQGLGARADTPLPEPAEMRLLRRDAPAPRGALDQAGRSHHRRHMRHAGERAQGILRGPAAHAGSACARGRRVEAGARATRFPAQGGPRIPDARQGDQDPERGRAPADQPGEPVGRAPDGHALHSGRADHRPAPEGQRAPGEHPEGPGRSGKHAARGRARPRRHRRGGPRGGPGPRGGRARGRGGFLGTPGAARLLREVGDGEVPERRARDQPQEDQAWRERELFLPLPAGRAGEQPEKGGPPRSPGASGGGNGRLRLGQEHAGARHALSRPRADSPRVARAPSAASSG